MTDPSKIDPAPSGTSKIIENSCALFVILYGASIFWRGIPFSSLWLDESLSYWIIKDGITDMYSRVIDYQGQSPLYYSLLWVTSKLIGNSEIALRVPSILATLVACVSLAKLVRRRIDKSLALFAVLSFILVDQVLVASISARPYAAALMCALLSVDYLDRAIENNRIRDHIYYLTFGVLTFYFHYLFALSFIVHIVWIVSRKSELRPHFLRRLIISAAIGTVVMAPGALHLHSLYRSAKSYSFALRPEYFDLVSVIFPANICVYLALSILIAALCGCQLKFALASMSLGRACLPLLVWWLTGPIVFFCVSRYTETSIFVQRYFLWEFTGFSFLLTILVKAIQPAHARRVVLSVFALSALLGEGGTNWVFEDWRKVPVIIHEWKLPADSPVFLYSGLVESKEIDWLSDMERCGYFLAPASYYGFDRNITLLPPTFKSTEAQIYRNERVAPILNQHSHFILICRRNFTSLDGDIRTENCAAYRDFFERAGFKLVKAREAGIVLVSNFARE